MQVANIILALQLGKPSSNMLLPATITSNPKTLNIMHDNTKNTSGSMTEGIAPVKQLQYTLK